MGEGASQQLRLHFFHLKAPSQDEGDGTRAQQCSSVPSPKAHLLEERMKCNKTGGGNQQKKAAARPEGARWAPPHRAGVTSSVP